MREASLIESSRRTLRWLAMLVVRPCVMRGWVKTGLPAGEPNDMACASTAVASMRGATGPSDWRRLGGTGARLRIDVVVDAIDVRRMAAGRVRGGDARVGGEGISVGELDVGNGTIVSDALGSDGASTTTAGDVTEIVGCRAGAGAGCWAR